MLTSKGQQEKIVKFAGKHCKQLEDCTKGHTRNAFAQIKKIGVPFMGRKGIIKDKQGKELSN